LGGDRPLAEKKKGGEMNFLTERVTEFSSSGRRIFCVEAEWNMIHVHINWPDGQRRPIIALHCLYKEKQYEEPEIPPKIYSKIIRQAAGAIKSYKIRVAKRGEKAKRQIRQLWLF